MRLDRSTSLLFASILSFCGLWGGQAIAQTAPTASDQELQRELLLQVVGTNSEALVGQLPPELPIDLPLPDQARIIGSIVAVDDQDNRFYFDYAVYLVVPRSPQQVIAFYQEQFSRAGWIEEDFASPGFVRTETDGFPSTISSNFRKDAQLVNVLVGALPNTQTATVSVQLSRMSEQPDPLRDQVEAISDLSASIPVPELTAPPSTQVLAVESQSSGNAGSISNWRSSASIESSLTNQAIASHYVSQLEQAGWQQQVNDITDSTAWSFLTLQDEEGQRWQGFLTIVSAAEPNTYTASFFVINTSVIGSVSFNI